MLRILVPLAVAVALVGRASSQDLALPVRRARPFLKGVCLSLHDEDQDRDYAPEVAEIASRTLASHLSVVFHLGQERRGSPAPGRGPKTPTDEALRRVLRAAREHGLSVLLTPVVTVEEAGAWRAKLSPPDGAAWFEGYERELLAYARLAAEEKAGALSVGSELTWSQDREARWRELIRDVRGVFPGALTYGANWDAYERVPFWDALDWIGVSAYYELAKAPGASVPELRRAWETAKRPLLAWHARAFPEKPLVFTEVGYPSQPGGAVQPWNYVAADAPDLEAQRRCYEAFAATWGPERALAGAFFYEWWGEGGPDDTQYTPRGKPAEETLRRFFGDLRVVERR